MSKTSISLNNKTYSLLFQVDEEIFDMSNITGGEILKYLRKKHKLYQRELVSKIKEKYPHTSINQERISKFERNDITIGIRRAKIFGEVFNCNYRVFL